MLIGVSDMDNACFHGNWISLQFKVCFDLKTIQVSPFVAPLLGMMRVIQTP